MVLKNINSSLRAVILILISFAVIGCIMFLWRSRKLKKTNFVCYCIALAASDLSFASCFLSNMSGLSAAIETEMYQQVLGSYIMTAGTCSVNLQVLIAIERLLSSKIQLQARQQYGLCRMVATIFFFAFAPAAAMTAGIIWTFYPEKPFELDPEQIDFGINWDADTPAGLLCITLVCFFGYAVPVAVILVCYILVIKRHNRRVTIFTNDITRRTRKVNLICFVSSLGFVIAWTPYTICGMLYLVDSVDAGPIWWLVSNMAAKTSAIYNVFQFWSATLQLTAPTVNPVRRKSSVFTVAVGSDDDGRGVRRGRVITTVAGKTGVIEPRRDFVFEPKSTGQGTASGVKRNSETKPVVAQSAAIRRTSDWNRRLERVSGVYTGDPASVETNISSSPVHSSSRPGTSSER